MIIRRVQVEGGFLDGLDLPLESGLNVIIGPRGVGKTSVVELIRYCLGVPAFTDQARAQVREHVLSVLADGRVTLRCETDGEEVIVTRSAAEAVAQTSSSGRLRLPIILSQNEIEALGLDGRGRLRMLDEFRSRLEATESEELAAATIVRSLTNQVASLAAEISDLREQTRSRASLTEKLEAVRRGERDLMSSVKGATADRSTLATLDKSAAGLRVELDALDRTRSSLKAWLDQLDSALRRAPEIETWPVGAAGLDPLEQLRAAVSTAKARLLEAHEALAGTLPLLADLSTDRQHALVKGSDEARRTRKRLDDLSTGAGALTREIGELETSLSKIAAVDDLIQAKEETLASLQAERTARLDELDTIRERRFEERSRIASELNVMLGPRLQVNVDRFATYTGYVNALSSALRGSGLHYNTLAPLIASRMSPREMVEMVENFDVAGLAEMAEIGEDRAARLIDHLRETGMEDVVTADVDDAVVMSLLDGGDYKATPELSTGQRCTVVLPVILSHKDRAIIVDQPEDHLDNGFIADTLIKAIRARSSTSQLIFTTHNANIPVLGSADSVALLRSDGKRGFLQHSGSLEMPSIVESISTVMEGGREAFRIRAAFYASVDK